MYNMLVADECWIALAKLQRQSPEREGFFPREIVRQLSVDSSGPARAGVQPHLSQHNVANAKPSSAKYRMFLRLPSGELRLYRPGDVTHPDRKGKTAPQAHDLPAELRELLAWYHNDYCHQARAEIIDPVLAMVGAGKELWADQNGDSFIRRERDPENWETNETPDRVEELWRRLIQRQGEKFHTVTGKPFRYSIEGNGVWFEREGRRINKRMARSDFEKAVARLPLRRTADIKDCVDYAYLYALLTDSRIVRRTDLAA
jgi:hypothetical protein